MWQNPQTSAQGGPMPCHAVMASRAMPGHIFACHAIFLRVMPCHKYSGPCHVRIFVLKMVHGLFGTYLQLVGTWVQNSFRNLVSLSGYMGATYFQKCSLDKWVHGCKIYSEICSRIFDLGINKQVFTGGLPPPRPRGGGLQPPTDF